MSSEPIEPLLSNKEVAGIFGYKLPNQASAWSQFAKSVGVPLVSLGGRIKGDPRQIREFIASRSTGKAVS